MKLEKIKLTELVDAELNEREMCRILGGGTPGCCQCGCHYATSGGSSTSNNDSANNRDGLRSDPAPLWPIFPSLAGYRCAPGTDDRICGFTSDPVC